MISLILTILGVLLVLALVSNLMISLFIFFLDLPDYLYKFIKK